MTQSPDGVKPGAKSGGSRELYVFATAVLILWVAYRTFVMVSDGYYRGYGIVPIIGRVIRGTIFDLRTVALFIGVILLGRKLRKLPSNVDKTETR